jgi:hypothetical protein
MKGLKIGITAASHFGDAHSVLWSSGVHQNVVFLAMLFQRLAEVELTAVVASPDQTGPHPLATAIGLPSLPLETAVAELDIIIELGARADAESMGRFRDRGGRLVSYMAGNVMVMNFEALANGSGHGEVMCASGFDAVWITPQHWRMNQGYAAMTRGGRCEMAPHIWHPSLLMQSAARLGVDPFWRNRDADAPWRIGVFDPTVNVVKTFHLPLLVCEEAYRRRPDLIDRVLMFGAERLKPAPHFQEFCGATDLSRDGRLFAESRFPLAEMLGRHVDAVVTHQWENDLNYLYWDVLYLGWPLIHNSVAFQSAGAWYPAFDPAAGGEALCAALDGHAARDAEARAAERDTLWRFHIDNPLVQARHSELLASLMG